MKNGYRLKINDVDYLEEELPLHYTGGKSLRDCPNCKSPMFTAFSLDCSSKELLLLDIWNQPRFTVLFCPFCSFFMEPYYLIYSNNEISIKGGDKEYPEIIQEIDTPYDMRLITLEQINSKFSPLLEKNIEKYLSRTIDEGVYHQIGGNPFTGMAEQMNCCKCSSNMNFVGILDYDDLNIPLYENNKEPVALIIGDSDCMNIYACKQCSVLGMKWVSY